MITKKQLQQLLKLILHTDSGLREYRYRNSRLKPVGHQEPMKGAIFTFASKELMQQSRGMVMTSVESVADHLDCFSHWTPNIYCYGTYANPKQHVVKGHSEQNLRQINTFVVDFDSKHPDYSAILETCYDLGFLPTAILETPRGYQAYFVLDKPAFVTKKTDYKVIAVAKKISTALREQFQDEFTVDAGCNHFGIAREPKTGNVVYCDFNACYSFSQWLNWSLKQADNHTAGLHVVKNYRGPRQIDEPWFDLLLHQGQIKGEKGRLGRNNAIFTLALAFYASDKSQDACLVNLNEFNARLAYPLKDSEVRRTVASAYKGDYQAANRQYIVALLQDWVDANLTAKDLFTRQGWYHTAKPRTKRKLSHLAESKADLLKYLSAKSSPEHPYVEVTLKQVTSELHIATRTFYSLRKRLEADGEAYCKTVKKGCHSLYRIASKKMILLSLLLKKSQLGQKKQAYLAWLKDELGLAATEIVAFEQAIVGNQMSSTLRDKGLQAVNQP